MIKVVTRPETRDEIRRAVDIRCAEAGISRSTYAVKHLGISPQSLYGLLDGRTRISLYPDVMKKIGEFTGATMASWEK